jgi:broad specificity phosphatase PhoE
VDGKVDLGLLDAVEGKRGEGEGKWNDKSKGTRWEPEMKALEKRAREARVWLRELGKKKGDTKEEEAHIVVVTHGGFLHFLTQDWDGMKLDKGTGWDNTEWRVYEFVEEGDEARLGETKESYRARRGSMKGLTETEQRELKAAVGELIKKEFGGGPEGSGL